MVVNPRDPVFHVGFCKTGTKWLQLGYFATHPEIADIVEDRRQWDNEVLREIVLRGAGRFEPERCRELFLKDLERHCDNNRLPVYSAERLAGHPFTGGYDNQRVAHRIASAFPEAKVLIVIRNQMTMLPSMYKELVVAGFRGSFREMLDPDPALFWVGPAFSLDMLDYSTLIKRYSEQLPGGSVKVLLYEELKSDPKKFISSVSEFLAVKDIFASSLDEYINQTGARKGRSGHRVWNHFRRTLVNPYPILNLGRIPKLGRVVRPILGVTTRDSTSISPETTENLRVRFRKSNEELRPFLDEYQQQFLREYP